MSRELLVLDPKKVALVLIDLQDGITKKSLAPRSGAEVVARAGRIATRFRELGEVVVLVRVEFAPDGGDSLRVPTDETQQIEARQPEWSSLAPELGPYPGDIVLTKRQWGAFYGTELDLQLRRRSINTLVLGGIATNFGVESTARAAYEHGYAQVLVEDAMSAFSEEAHTFAIRTIFPRLGKVRSTDQVLGALSSPEFQWSRKGIHSS